MEPFLLNGIIVPVSEKWIYDFFGYEAVCPNDLRQYLNANKGKDVSIEINSPGGYVSEGCEMYSMLIQHEGKVKVTVGSMAASAASLILAAANHVVISPVGRIMIHNASSVVEGDYRDMLKASDNLQQINEFFADAYSIKTGLDKAELLKMMNAETFFNASRALELHFADEILTKKPAAAVAAIGSGIIPPKCIEKMRELLKDRANQQNRAAVAIEQENFNYLNLKEAENDD